MEKGHHQKTTNDEGMLLAQLGTWRKGCTCRPSFPAPFSFPLKGPSISWPSGARTPLAEGAVFFFLILGITTPHCLSLSARKRVFHAI